MNRLVAIDLKLVPPRTYISLKMKCDTSELDYLPSGLERRSSSIWKEYRTLFELVSIKSRTTAICPSNVQVPTRQPWVKVYSECVDFLNQLILTFRRSFGVNIGTMVWGDISSFASSETTVPSAKKRLKDIPRSFDEEKRRAKNNSQISVICYEVTDLYDGVSAWRNQSQTRRTLTQAFSLSPGLL